MEVKEMDVEFKKLSAEGEVIRNKINNNLIKNDYPQDKLKNLWIDINLLISNEIEQENLCNN